jgi:hypothetical protein
LLSSRQEDCLRQAGKTALADALPGHDIIKAVADSVGDGTAKPLKDLISPVAAVDGAKKGAQTVAKNPAAQKTIAKAMRRLGARVSAKEVGRVASKFVKSGPVVSTGYALYGGYEEYKACMNN